MDPLLQYLLIGYALGVIPTRKAAVVSVAFLSKRLGVKPKDIREYEEATDDTDK